MSLRIQTNVEALNAHRNLVNVNDSVSKSMERLELRLPDQPRV